MNEKFLPERLMSDCKRCITPLAIALILYSDSGIHSGMMSMNMLRDRLNTLSGGNVQFTQNHLYNVLYLLHEEGIISKQKGMGKKGNPCDYYKLTTEGKSKTKELVDIYSRTDNIVHILLNIAVERGF